MARTYQKKKRLRRGSKNTHKIYTQKYFNGQDNHDEVVAYLEPDMLEFEIK